MTAKSRGTAREYKVRDAYRESGYYAFRTRDDQSVCDVVAMRQAITIAPTEPVDAQGDPLLARVLMVEVKSNKGGPYMHFRKEAREALRVAAAKAGATPLLVHWPMHGKRRDIPESEWPDA